MTSTRGLVAFLVTTFLLAGCGGGSTKVYESASTGESSLEMELKAPPVPKDLSTTTSTPATGATYYVDPNGDDGAKGDKANPFKTIAHGVSKLKAGDTLLLQSGTYVHKDADAGLLVTGLNGTADKPITIAAAAGAAPKIIGGEWSTITIAKSSYVVVRGLETEGTAKVDKKPTSGIEVEDSHHVTFVANYVHDGGGGGISTNRSNHVDIIANYVSGMAKWNPYQTSGISFFDSRDIGGAPGADGYSLRVIGNVVVGTENITLPLDGRTKVTDGNCVIVDSTDPDKYPGRTYIANNVCANNGGHGIHVFKAGNVVAVNNTMYHNLQTPVLKDDGEIDFSQAKNVIARNNLVIAREDRKAVNLQSVSGAVFTNNLYQRAKGDVPGTSDRMVDDVGVNDPANGDFSLRTGSVAIDAGSVTDAPALDQRGKKRTAKPDIGALEAAS